jgi:hypothetical protein
MIRASGPIIDSVIYLRSFVFFYCVFSCIVLVLSYSGISPTEHVAPIWSAFLGPFFLPTVYV